MVFQTFFQTLFGHTRNLYNHQFPGEENSIIDFRNGSYPSVLMHSEVRPLQAPLSASR